MTKKDLIKTSALLLLSTLGSVSYAQDNTLTMTLSESLAYAKEHSITLQQSKLDLDDYKIDVASAKSAFLPSVSGSVGQTFSNSPLTKGDSKNNYNGSYGVDLSMKLYSGGENSLALKQSKLYTQIGELGIKQAENTIEESITLIYVQILYAQDMIEVAKIALELSQKNIERGKIMLEVGSINETDFSQLVTNEATAQYDLILAKTTLSNKYVELKHLLEITDTTTLQVDGSDLETAALTSSIPSVNEVYLAAMDIRPEIASSSLYVENAKINERIARSGFLPTLSLSAGIGINHLSGTSYNLGYQLQQNYNNSIGLNLSIPIFSRFENRNAVNRSKNATKYATLNYDEQSKTLYKTIETLHNNAENATAMYNVSKAKIEALKKSLLLVTKQFEVGAKDIIDLLTEQSDMRESAQELLESKYTLIYNKAILEFYKNGVIKL